MHDVVITANNYSDAAESLAGSYHKFVSGPDPIYPEGDYVFEVYDSKEEHDALNHPDLVMRGQMIMALKLLDAGIITQSDYDKIANL